MMNTDTQDPRLLFVLDNDFGELTTVMYLLSGQDLAGRSTLMLPDRVHRPNRDTLPVRTQRYEGLKDLLAVVEAEQPAIVFLCSAYLFSTHGTLSLTSLEQLVQHLRDSGRRVVTTDPFLGLVSRPDFRSLIDFSFPEGGIDAWSWKFLKQAEEERLVRNLTDSHEILKDIPHLYPVAPGLPGEEDTGDGLQKISFFNPALIAPPQGSPASSERADGHENGSRPFWVFVLAMCDYDILTTCMGRQVFVEQTLAKLMAGRAAGRRAVFIGPKECVESLRHRLGGAPDIELLTFCSYGRFMSLLLEAELAFYWNAVSHSILVRLFNGLPVFLFDRGHLARNLQAIYPRIVQWYYQGWEPIYLDLGSTPTMDQLSRLADDYRSAAQRITRQLQRSPAPAEMIRDLCQPALQR